MHPTHDIYTKQVQTSANSLEHWKSFKPVNLNPFFSNLEIISPTYTSSTQQENSALWTGSHKQHYPKTPMT